MLLLPCFIQIGEQTIKIDDVLKNKSGYIPWTMIKGLRNIAVHEYQYVDAEKIYQICTSHIPQLQQNVEHFIKESIKVNQLSAFELKLSEGSEFYTHIRFKNLVDS